MSGVEKIRSAEAQVAELQDALAAVQLGLERAEAVATAAEAATVNSERLIKVALGLFGVAIAVVLVGSRRRSVTN